MRIVFLSIAAALGARAQDPLSLRDAVKMALAKHPAVEAASARIQAAGARVDQARGGLMPQVRYTEMFQSGNNPVYVFGALLTQRQFTANNFALGSLNRPDPLNNFQSTVTAEQLLYDFGGLRKTIHAAELGRKISEEEKKSAELMLAAGTARAYHGVTLASEGLTVAREALKTAEADQARAETIRAAGMATDADVLSIKVHVASMREQVIRRQADLRIAQASLNDALGLPLDTQHKLTTELTPAGAALKTEAVRRPEIEMARLGQEAATAQAAAAKAGYWPQFFLRGAFEADRQNFATKGGANWMFAAGLKWTLFDGNRTRNAVAEAQSMSHAAAAGQRQVQSAVQLEVRRAQAEFDSATERIQVTDATIAQAEESLRILRNRYSNGLATVTDLLRAQTALLDAKMRRLGSIYEQRLAAVAVEQAEGILNGDSNVLQ
ncbi:TolC family protein [Paludibaculum fermentans]|uniref:TolC family protein n=1 Tax=Paludibaculum fermentans TaxID=1473598 RepID=A0A7S7NTH6_PALFE|nr:TolC family protein [Paludibaculum fermentans]QOY89426.1 TolC family protein [Paludibaculum fermentans]